MFQVRSKRNFSCSITLACLSFLLSVGCTGEKLPDGMPKPWPTTITIIQDGQPLEGASIALIPMESSNPWNAGAITDASGKAALMTSNQYHGVVPGKYYVVINKLDKAIDLRDADDPTVAGYDKIDPKFAKISPDAETIEVVQGKNEKSIDVGQAVKIKRVLNLPKSLSGMGGQPAR